MSRQNEEVIEEIRNSIRSVGKSSELDDAVIDELCAKLDGWNDNGCGVWSRRSVTGRLEYLRSAPIYTTDFGPIIWLIKKQDMKVQEACINRVFNRFRNFGVICHPKAWAGILLETLAGETPSE